MANKGRSEQGLFGTIHHYDSNGTKVGRSEPGLFGGYTNYDANGHKTGRSDPGIFGGYTHYDSTGHKVGKSEPGIFGSYHHKDASGKSVGSSDPGLFDSYHHNDSQGCYVATCVYGSYDCPQVWTLRRFRDNTLSQSDFGRLFIHTYYAVSPRIVKWFGQKKWFKDFWKKHLDKLVNNLNSEGVENTPYNDRPW